MAEKDWIEMMEQMQSIRLFARLNVRRKRQSEHFSAESLDLLSRVALAREPLTPLILCKQTGLTKPMMSKLIEELNGKGFLNKEQDPKDKRSYFLILTEEGKKELNNTYQYYLEPVYKIWRHPGEAQFGELMKLINLANRASQE